MWGVGALMLVPLTLITLTKVNELAEVLLGRGLSRLIDVTARRAFCRRSAEGVDPHSRLPRAGGHG